MRLHAAPGADVVLGAVRGEPGVHAVGGAVRDVLLDRTPHELDLVVEGDAVEIARRAAERAGGTLTVHDRFGTATVHADGIAFDVASARRERYARPGALPDVELGATLRDDLARRDFTVNAMAVRLSDGALTEWEGARDDLAAGVLRVLHDGSFADDPTRMLRLVRYAARLGFRPDPHTDALIDPARFKTVSGERLGNELRQLIREPQPEAMRELLWHGMGQALLGEGFRVTDLVARAGPGLLALAACCTTIAGDELASRLDELGFTARERDAVVAAATGYERLRAPLASGELSDSEIWRLFRRERVETAELLAAGGAPGALRWLHDVRHRRLAITGDDLVAAGLAGVAIGAALDRVTEAMLDGRAPDRASQLAAALA